MEKSKTLLKDFFLRFELIVDNRIKNLSKSLVSKSYLIYIKEGL